MGLDSAYKDHKNLIDIMDLKRAKKRERKKKRKTAKKGEKEREKMPRVIYYQSAFNSQKEQLNILAEMLEISKSGFACGSIIAH